MAQRPRKRFGQHFLRPDWVPPVIDAIGPRPTDTFLEIGPGHGEITLPLARRAARVVAIEIDRDLAARLARWAPPNVLVVTGDVLECDLVPLLARLWGPSGGPESGPASVRVVGNLPYNISSPIVFRLLRLATQAVPLSDATLMVQQEVADRLAAKPGTAPYGVLGILVGLHAEVTRRLTLPPGAFRPSPKVTSSLLQLRFRPPAVAPADPRVFEALVRRAFTQRRKTLLNAVKPFAATTRLAAGDALLRAALDPRRRPQTLDLAEWVRLADVFAAVAPEPVV